MLAGWQHLWVSSIFHHLRSNGLMQSLLRLSWCHSHRRGSTPVSTVLRNSRQIFMINVFLIIKKHLPSLNLANIRSEWTEWLGNQGKGTLRSENHGGVCLRAPLEGLRLRRSFWRSVSIYPRSASESVLKDYHSNIVTLSKQPLFQLYVLITRANSVAPQ